MATEKNKKRIVPSPEVIKSDFTIGLVYYTKDSFRTNVQGKFTETYYSRISRYILPK